MLEQPLIEGNTKIHIIKQIQPINFDHRIEIDERRITKTLIGENRLRLQNLINDLRENLTGSLKESVIGVIRTRNRLEMRNEDAQIPDECGSRRLVEKWLAGALLMLKGFNE